MITYRTTAKSGEITTLAEPIPFCWINLVNPSDSEVDEIKRLTGAPEAMLKSALDEEETAHTDIEGGNTLIVVDIPVLENNNGSVLYTTLPLGIILSKEYFITVCLKDSALLSDFAAGRVRGFDSSRYDRFLLQLLYRNAARFLQYLRQIDKASHRIQAELYKSMKNKELIQLLELEKSLVYFSTSLRANEAVIEKLVRFDNIKNDPVDLNLLDDVILETKQAIEMSNIYRDILSSTMDAFASIISNNVNIVMKLLTIITIILTIPTLISSLWGMNVPVPFADNPIGFWLVSVLIAVVTTAGALLIIKHTKKIK